MYVHIYVPSLSGKPISLKKKKSLPAKWKFSSVWQQCLWLNCLRTVTSHRPSLQVSTSGDHPYREQRARRRDEQAFCPRWAIDSGYIIRQEIHLTKEEPAGGAHRRKVSFSDNPGRPSRLKQQSQKSRRQIVSKSPHNRPKGQKQQRGRSKSPKSLRSSAKNVTGKGFGPVK